MKKTQSHTASQHHQTMPFIEIVSMWRPVAAGITCYDLYFLRKSIFFLSAKVFLKVKNTHYIKSISELQILYHHTVVA